MTYSLSQADVEAILGRSLTNAEKSTLTTTTEQALQDAQDLLGIDWKTLGERTYFGSEGYRTLFTDPYSILTSVTVNGATITDYRTAFDDWLNTPSFNSIIFAYPLEDNDEVVVAAEWGFGSELPYDIKRLAVALWQNGTAPQTNPTSQKVKSKSNLDFSVTYDTSKTALETILVDYGNVIEKYSMRIRGDIGHGRIRRVRL